MSYQYPSVRLSPAYEIVRSLFEWFAPKGYGYATFSCPSPPNIRTVEIKVTRMEWDGEKLTIAGTFTAPDNCVLTDFGIWLMEGSYNFGGYGAITDISVGAEAGQAFTVYLVESLTKPTQMPTYVA